MSIEFYNGNRKLKAAGVQLEMTDEQLDELSKCIDDPIYFIRNYVNIIHVDKGLIPFDMWPFQEEIVKLYHENRHVILKLPRQAGKCVSKETTINIRNKKTGEIHEISIQDFFELIKNK